MKTLRIAVGMVLITSWFAFALSPKGSGSASEAGPAEFDHSSLRPPVLRGEVWSTAEALALPGDIAVTERELLVVDRMGDPALHVFDKRTGRLTASVGRSGEGPGEFRAPAALDLTEGEQALWISDAALQRLTKINLQKPPDRLELERSPTLHLRAEAPVVSPVWVGRDRLLAHGFFYEGRLTEFNRKGTPTRSVGQLPPNPDGVPVNVLQHAYQGTLAVRPDRSSLVLATRHAGYLELYAGDGHLAGRVSGPFPFEPRFSVRSTERGHAMTSGQDLRFGYIDVAATRDRIYALFSGRTRAGFPGSANYGEYVHVFDWEGEFLEAWTLDADAFTVVVDQEERALYAVRHHPEPAVMRYRLPEP